MDIDGVYLNHCNSGHLHMGRPTTVALIKRCDASIGPNTCYGDFEALNHGCIRDNAYTLLIVPLLQTNFV